MAQKALSCSFWAIFLSTVRANAESVQGRSWQAIRHHNAPIIQRPSPPQVIAEVAASNATERQQPCPKTAVISIHVLHMDEAAHSLARRRSAEWVAAASL